MAVDRQLKKPFDERHGERIFLVAGRETVAIGLIEGTILDRDVRRIAHHGVVLLAENAIQLRQILHAISRANALTPPVKPWLIVKVELVEASSMQQTISHRHVDAEAWCLF